MIEKLEDMLKTRRSSKLALWIFFHGKEEPKLGMYYVHNSQILQLYYPTPGLRKDENLSSPFPWNSISKLEEATLEEMVFLLREKDKETRRISRKLDDA